MSPRTATASRPRLSVWARLAVLASMVAIAAVTALSATHSGGSHSGGSVYGDGGLVPTIASAFGGDARHAVAGHTDAGHAGAGRTGSAHDDAVGLASVGADAANGSPVHVAAVNGALFAAATATESGVLAAAGADCATCAGDHEGAVIACAVALIVLLLVASFQMRRTSWVLRLAPVSVARVVVPPQRPVAPSLTALCISRT